MFKKVIVIVDYVKVYWHIQIKSIPDSTWFISSCPLTIINNSFKMFYSMEDWQKERIWILLLIKQLLFWETSFHYRIKSTATTIIKITHALNEPPTATGVALDTWTFDSSFIAKKSIIKRHIHRKGHHKAFLPCKI